MTDRRTDDRAEAADGSPTIGDVGERWVIAELRRTAAVAEGADLFDDIVVGTGDDAAVIDTTTPTVISTDTAVQGRHFRLDWSSAHEVGARAVVQSVADIAAMGGRPTGVVVSIAAPVSTPVEVILDLNRGIVDEAHRQGARVLGGDLVAAGQIVVTVTALGTLDDGVRAVELGDARAGDVLAVSGPLGAAAAGLAVLVAGDPALIERHASLVDSYRLPQPDLRQGIVAASAGVHAMTDISDGLVEELVTMSAAAGVCLSVSSEQIPRPDGLRVAATDLGADDRIWALTGGEDHELLAAFADVDAVPPGWTVIGSVVVGAGVLIDDAAPQGLHGWQSFSPTSGDGGPVTGDRGGVTGTGTRGD